MDESTGKRVVSLTAEMLSMPLVVPFAIASGAQPAADNVLVRVRLDDGTEGLGEAAPFPAVNGETQDQALAAARELGERVVDRTVGELRAIDLWHGCMSARCAVEVALLDAFCRSQRMSMWQYFGGAERTLQTDYTITTEQGAEAAKCIASRGFATLKVKVGGVSASEDEARIEAIVTAAPGLSLILDGNCAFRTLEDVQRLVRAAERLGAKVALVEQPFAPEDRVSQAALTRSGVAHAADESVQTVADVLRIGELQLANVINLKPMKSGFFACREMATVGQALGLQLMIGAMVESELSLSATACFAGGFGGFRFVDLDTHMFLAASPMRGGFVQEGPTLDVSGIRLGHGVEI